MPDVAEDKHGGYECTCIPGVTGLRCEVQINECESGPCINGGQCVDLIDSFWCICPETYTGL